MRGDWKLGRRGFGGMVAGLAAVSLMGGRAQAAAPDGAGAIQDMVAGLQSANALSCTIDAQFGASVAKDKLKTLGNRASLVFQRPDSLFIVFGGDGDPDVQLLITGGEATIYRLSLAAKTVLKLAPENGAAFAVPGLFVPVLGLLSETVDKDFFGGITSVTAIAQGAPDQPESTSLAAVLGGGFTGEVWVARDNGLPRRVTGTWFGAKGDVAASAVLNFSGWSAAAPVAGAFTVKGLPDAKTVELGALGL